MNLDILRYTWRRRNPTKQARLDYFVISKPLTDLICSCKIRPGYRTDHSRIDLDIILNSFEQGKGVWKLNCSLLKNPEYLILIKESIKTVKKTYSVPVYNPECFDLIPDSDIVLVIEDDIFLEMFS